MDLHLLSRQFGSFGLIGGVAFFVDTGILYGAMGLLGMDGYSGRALSWLGAVTFTWYLNRRFTFGSESGVPMALQWLRFLAANSVGGLINFVVYAALVATMPIVKEWLVLGVAAGAVCGLIANFFLSRQLVFARSKPDRFSPDS